jgi:uncharacterized protein YciI
VPADGPIEFDRYSLVLLRRGPRAAEYSGEELDRLQEAHLAHLRTMRERGVLAASGPFGEQPDETYRGLCLYRTELEETKRLAGEDPSVRAGRMAAEVMSWYVPKGTLAVRA